MKMSQEWLTEQRLLALLLVLFASAATVYSVATPLFEMSDELWHYPMVKTLADGNGLPVQDPLRPGPWKQEGSQPPLYYYVAALATAWIDTSDVGEVLRPNPHVDNGVVTLDGNNNLIAHNYRRESWPWRGAVLAVHIARLVSMVFGVGTVYFTYRLGAEVFPEKRWLAMAGAAAVAFTPMFAFISGAVNNDSMAAMLSAAALWLMVRITGESEAARPTHRLAAALGITLGLAALTKTSTLGLFGLAGLTIAYAAWRTRRWQTFFLEGSLIIALAAATAGWWYVRNWQLYGDPLGLNVFIEILGRRARPASLLQLWGERVGFMQSYWGLFGGVNIPMPDWVYDVLNALAIMSLAGISATLVLKTRREGTRLSAWMPILLSLLWIAGVVVPLTLSWARITWSSQGRLVFSAISCISLWFAAGLGYPLPERWGQRTTGIVVAFMAGLTFVAPFAWIGPRYCLPDTIAESGTGPGIDFSERGQTSPTLRLIDYYIDTRTAQPGGMVSVTLVWESVAPTARNWSAFVHLEDSAEFLAGQRDTYPGLGLIATQDLEPGYRWSDTFVVPVQPAAYAPEILDVKVGLYDWATCSTSVGGCERMVTADGQEAVSVGAVDLQARATNTNVPNPVRFNFGDQMMLSGYQLDRRIVRPGESMSLTLFWQGLQSMDTNYTISAQVLGPETRNYGQKDSWPLDGALPTSAWIPGLQVEDTMRLTIQPDTPSGVYNIQIVVYSAETSAIERLQIVTDDGRLVDDFVILTQVRVVP